MSYLRSNLPKEIVLCIIQYISNWEDRCQFALTSKYHWSCITDSVQLREVDLDETNLLKLKIARGLRLVSSFCQDEDAAKTFRKIHICSKLRTIVVSGNTFAPTAIKKILRAANMKHRMEIMVSANSYTEWAKILDGQKFKSGIIDLQCDIDDEDLNRKPSNDMSNFDAYLASVNFHHYSCTNISEDSIRQDANSVALQLGSYFVGSIVCFDKIKILVTSLDLFFHVSDIDDCAYSNTWLNKSVFAKLHMKTEKGNKFFELSLIVDGCVELLAVGGLVVINGGSVEPFLGSSVKPLNRAKAIDGDLTTTNILVREKMEVVTSERLLRQYYKRDSCKQWSFHSKNIYEAGFFPVNPLHVDDHPSVSSLPLTVQSNLLKMLAMKLVDRDILASIFCAIVDSTMLSKELKVPDFTGISFLDLYNAMNINDKWKTVIGIAKDLEAGSVNFQDDKHNVFKNKKVTLQLVNSGYLGSLSRMNDKNCDIFKRKMSQ